MPLRCAIPASEPPRVPLSDPMAADHPTLPPWLAPVARGLRVDAYTGEAAGALVDRGIAPVLLKGPVLATWLYDDDEARAYVDADLLVDPARLAESHAVLTALGFERVAHEWERHTRRVHHATTWLRAEDDAIVDLHHTLPGVRGATPETVWRVLSGHTVAWPLPRTTVRALDAPARAVLVALHAFHHRDHGTSLAKALADLERAIARADVATWRAAAALADELRAQADFTAGLHAAAGGRALAATLRLPAPSSGDDETAGLERLTAIRSARGVAGALRDGLFPSRSYLRWSSPIARRGSAGLAGAYLLRPVFLLRSLTIVTRRALARRFAAWLWRG